MNLNNKESDEADDIPEQSFGIGARGRWASAAGRPAPGVNITVWVPLLSLPWGGTEYRVADDVWIREKSSYRGYEASTLAEFLSEDERERCRSAQHWLQISSVAHSDPSAHALINAFLLSLWITRPTRTHAAVRFEEASSGARTVSRMLSRFQWVEGHVDESLDERDLRDASEVFSGIRNALSAHRRLADALVLTFHACTTHQWKPAFLYFAIALEALLAHREEAENATDLATFYGALLSRGSSSAREPANELHRLYSLRHAILHGQIENNDQSANLDRLASLADCLRLLWKRVLLSDTFCSALESDDRSRRALLAELQKKKRGPQ